VDAIGEELGQSKESLDVDHAAPGWVGITTATNESAEGEKIATWVAALLEHGLDPESLASDEDAHVVAEDIAVLGRSAATLRGVGDALERLDIPSAMAIRPEDWVTSPFGSALVALMTWYVGDDFVPRRVLAGLLEASGRNLTDIPAVLGAMEAMDEPWPSLAEVVGRGSPQAVIDGISAIKIDDSDARAAEWEADRQQIAGAWEDYCRRTDVADRSWAGFRIHISRVQRSTDLTDGVRLMTIHKAQGREFRAVAVVGLNDGQLPDFRNVDNPEGLESELRAFYVAASRPTRMLLLSRAQHRRTRYGSRQTEPSRFLALVGAALG
ncbi:MAG: 3'-5' exonuclease, partial [Acidimicrobiales bacterium]